MPWKYAPPEIRDAVNRELGYDVYVTARRAFDRAMAADPNAVISRFFSTPEEHARIQGAVPLSQHLAGLAVDVTPSPGRYEPLAEALRREGFWVKTYPSRSHLHAQVFEPARFQKILPILRRLGIYGGR